MALLLQPTPSVPLKQLRPVCTETLHLRKKLSPKLLVLITLLLNGLIKPNAKLFVMICFHIIWTTKGLCLTVTE